MAYIRERTEELTGYQEHADWQPNIDLQCDFVMVYGIDASMPERVKNYKSKGYVVHLMTGIAWGEYQDYLFGKFDGREHWEESQMDRHGEYILHGKEVPYMVPSIAFTDYLTEKLKIAVDAGVEAIHMEEPEFWDYGGYSEAFRREYLLYYREEWQPPHNSLDARYKCARLKAYLYARAIGRIGSALKEYALTRYGKVLRFYVPTHSLINYTQWKIMSPEGALIDLPAVDGYIAQVWTGTSRSANVYEGVVKERTFETAYLEYGIMQELVKGTGRRMWFLHDPIEDNPEYTWEDYRNNYLKTAIASLLHPGVHTYEICPWPRRVFDGVFPRKAGLAGGTIPTTNLPGAKAIPAEYATLLNSMVQLFGDMDQEEYHFDGITSSVGILMSDSGLFERSYPDSILTEDAAKNYEYRLRSLTRRMHDGEDCSEESRSLLKETAQDPELYSAFVQSSAFPNFFGMALPLLKYGLPVRPLQLDNIRRFPGYLDDYKLLILSYEYIKPESPDVNNALAAWVKSGGTLLYLGDGKDPYHTITGWWNRTITGGAGDGYPNPAEHLFDMLGISKDAPDGHYSVQNGRVMIWRMAPAMLCIGPEQAKAYRDRVKLLLRLLGEEWNDTGNLTLHRGPYVISTMMEEKTANEEKTFQGLFADMLKNDYEVITTKRIIANESTILFDFSQIEGVKWRVIGCSARVFSLTETPGGNGFTMEVKAADQIKAFLRIRLPRQVKKVDATDTEGKPVEVSFVWDEASCTVLLAYESANQTVMLRGSFED